MQNIIYSAKNNEVDYCLKSFGLNPFQIEFLYNKKSGRQTDCAMAYFRSRKDAIKAVYFAKLKILKFEGTKIIHVKEIKKAKPKKIMLTENKGKNLKSKT